MGGAVRAWLWVCGRVIVGCCVAVECVWCGGGMCGADTEWQFSTVLSRRGALRLHCGSGKTQGVCLVDISTLIAEVPVELVVSCSKYS